MNIKELRDLFPITQKWIYFNHAVSSPLNLKALSAMSEILEDMMNNGVANLGIWIKNIEETRESVASLLNASKDNIGFIRNYVEGLSLIAKGFNWSIGDNVLLLDMELEPITYNWLNLGSEGVEVKFIPTREGKVSLEEIINVVDSNTRMIILSHVQYLTGYRLYFSDLAAYCKEKDILLVVEGSNSVGALNVDVQKESFDVLIASGNKWLLGPEECGIIYLSQRAMEKLTSTTVSWRVAEFGQDSSDYPIKFYESARRFEPSGLSVISIYGLRASLRLITEIGIDQIEKRILSLSTYLANKLKEKNYDVHSELEPGKMSGIISFSSKVIPSKEILYKMMKSKIIISEKRGYIIISLHYYNTEDEIDKFITLLE